MKGLAQLMRNRGVGWCIEVRNTVMPITCMDFCGEKVDSSSIAP